MSLIMPNGSRTVPFAGSWKNGQPGPAGGGQQYVPQRPTIQRPGQAQSQQSAYDTATPYGGKPQSAGQWNQGGTNQQQTRQPQLQQYMAQGSPYPGQKIRLADPIRPEQLQQNPYGQGTPSFDPNVANNPYANRPAPFQATTQNFDGTQSQMPNFQQRDAFIGQINNQLGQMQGQSWQQPGMGAPQFNFPQMWGQAGQMAQQGWQNPFAPGGGSENQIRQLLGDSTPDGMRNPGSIPQLPPGAIADGAPQGGRMVSRDAWDSMYPGAQYPEPSAPRIPANGQNAPIKAPPGWKKEIEGPGWMSPNGQYWDGQGAAPWSNAPQSPGTAQPIHPQYMDMPIQLQHNQPPVLRAGSRPRGADNIQADPGMMKRYQSDMDKARAQEAEFRQKMDAARGTPQHETFSKLHRRAQDAIADSQFMMDYYSPGADQQSLVKAYESQINARRKTTANKRA